ncbi:hypothetical protein LNKW23_18230 [Paralimibaculum aggregatum]|uniref:Helix-turn-helix DNA binding domain protein n=1 Tax=Paralimibaculum aggregatum TaxID=3036245 RepID=A0ABQ6LK54_9RHOB|nr:hypothetical protein LNKW23_18230 [Limibaculum sp. NKW23]
MDDIFDSWPSMAEMARDIGELDVTVRGWRRRGMIPAWAHLRIVEAARARGLDLTFEDIARACAARARHAGPSDERAA